MEGLAKKLSVLKASLIDNTKVLKSLKGDSNKILFYVAAEERLSMLLLEYDSLVRNTPWFLLDKDSLTKMIESTYLRKHEVETFINKGNILLTRHFYHLRAKIYILVSIYNYVKV